jgi:pilus assembly protein CpaF
MVLMSGMDLPVRAIREQIGDAIHMIIHLARLQDGSRRVSRVTEVCGMEGEKIILQDLFEFKQTGLSPEGKVLGKMQPTGNVPTFIDEIRARGLHLDPAIFDPLRAEEFAR